MTSAPAIGFEYRPSRWLGRLLTSTCCLAATALWLADIPWALKLAGTLVLGCSLWKAWRGQSLVTVRAAGWARDGGWSLRMHAGEDVAGVLASFRVVGEAVVWLRLSLPEKRHVVLLLAPDNSDADIRRRLRMRLAQVEAAGHSGG
ncbi:protein YgfX [Dyella sp. C11]|uniref:protein YgfX n=1 Tax=Dyella sp. C11 TaxID=2126991 RepID=UPI000D64CB56|nr:protein YgfX [Dyella sp. C11]